MLGKVRHRWDICFSTKFGLHGWAVGEFGELQPGACRICQPPTANFWAPNQLFFFLLYGRWFFCFSDESFGAWAWAWWPKLSLPKMALSAKFLGWPKNLFYIDPTQDWMVPMRLSWHCNIISNLIPATKSLFHPLGTPFWKIWHSWNFYLAIAPPNFGKSISFRKGTHGKLPKCNFFVFKSFFSHVNPSWRYCPSDFFVTFLVFFPLLEWSHMWSCLVQCTALAHEVCMGLHPTHTLCMGWIREKLTTSQLSALSNVWEHFKKMAVICLYICHICTRECRKDIK